MDPFEVVNQVESDERFTGLDLGQKIQVRTQMLNSIKSTDTYRYWDSADQTNFDKQFLTRGMAGLDEASLLVGDEQDERSALYLQQAKSARETGKADINFGDGFVETGKDYLTGKVVAFATDLFTEDDTTDYLYGDRSDDYKAYRDYVLETLDADGMTDYKVGKALGHVGGFIGDSAAAMSLYGSVGSAGLLTKSFGGFGSKLAGQAFKSTGSKMLAYTPAFLGQMGFETAAYVGETAVADMITGTLDKDTELQEYLKTVPSTLGQGLMYFAVGEALGAGVGNAFKGMGSVFTGKGFQERSLKMMMQDPESMMPSIMKVIKGGTDADIELRALLKSGGMTSKDTNKILESLRDARIWADPETLKKNPTELKRLAMKQFYGIDAEINGDSLQIKSFGGDQLKNPVNVNTGLELQEFLVKNYTEYKNKEFKFSSLMASNKKGTIKVEVETQGSKELLSMDAGMFNSTFRPSDGSVKVDSLQDITKRLVRNDEVNVKVVEDYFSTGHRSRTSNNEILIPKTIKNADEAAMFARNYFNQVKAITTGNVKFNTKQLETMLKATSNIRYDEDFLKLIYRPASFKVNTDGSVDMKLDGTWTKFANIEDAGRQAHMGTVNEGDVNRHLAKTLGGHMQIDPDTGSIKVRDDASGKVLMEYKDMDDLFKDGVSRPPLGFAARGDFKAFSADAIEDGTTTLLESGNIEVARKKLKKYSKTKAFVNERYETSLGKIEAEPKFQKFKVTQTDSGITNEFNTLETARRWLDKDFSKYSVLEKEMWDKGWRITPVEGGYTIRTDGMAPKFAKNMDDAKELYKTLDDFVNVEDTFSEIPASTLRGAETFIKEQIVPFQEKLFKKQQAAQIKAKGYLGNKINRWTDKMWKPIRQRFEKFADPIALKHYNKLEAGDKAFKTTYGQVKQRMHAMYHGKGRNFDPTQLRQMGQILKGERGGNWATYAKEQNIDLTEAMSRTLTETRDLFDTLGQRFGIDDKEWVEFYFPRLANLSSKEVKSLTNVDPMKKAMGKTNTKDIDAWFEHIRIEDYVEGQFEENIEAVLDTYVRVGLRKQFLSPAIADIRASVKAGDIKSDEASTLLLKSSDQAAGRMYSSERAEEVAERVKTNKARAERILAGEGKYQELTPEQRQDKAMDAINSDWKSFSSDLVTSSLMAFKMKMPIRNIAQVWNIGSTMMGSEYVLRGQKFVGSEAEATALYKELLNKGIIKPRDGIELHGPSIQKWIKEVNRNGMNNFYHSDDYTRLVMSKAARERFKDGFALLEKRDLDLEGFVKFTKADWFNEVDQKQFVKLLGNKDYNGAETLLMRRTTQMTMFEYDLLNRPEGMTSGIGRLWGQYGTYPSQYLAFMQRGWQKDKMAFVAKLGAATAMVSMVYNDLLNISGMPGTPFETAMFTGSPVFSSAVSVANALNTGGLNAESLLRNTTIAMPLYGIGRSTVKGFEEIAEGQYFDGLTRFLGATPSDEMQYEKVLDFGDTILNKF